MALPDQYLLTTKKVDAYFDAILNAQTPPKFTQKFLEQLEFKATADRLFVGVLKALKFIDQSSIPQDRYFRFLDRSQSRKVLAEAIKDAYSDLFAVNTKANEMSSTEVKNKFKTLTQGAKSDDVLGRMANTFVALCKYADFSSPTSNEVVPIVPAQNHTNDTKFNHQPSQDNNRLTHELINKQITTELHYNIQIHLPETRDPVVYDAIFKSLKEHLL